MTTPTHLRIICISILPVYLVAMAPRHLVYLDVAGKGFEDEVNPSVDLR